MTALRTRDSIEALDIKSDELPKIEITVSKGETHSFVPNPDLEKRSVRLTRCFSARVTGRTDAQDPSQDRHALDPDGNDHGKSIFFPNCYELTLMSAVSVDLYVCTSSLPPVLC
jgi:hypothetical protein